MSGKDDKCERRNDIQSRLLNLLVYIVRQCLVAPVDWRKGERKGKYSLQLLICRVQSVCTKLAASRGDKPEVFFRFPGRDPSPLNVQEGWWQRKGAWPGRRREREKAGNAYIESTESTTDSIRFELHSPGGYVFSLRPLLFCSGKNRSQ